MVYLTSKDGKRYPARRLVSRDKNNIQQFG